ncbi:hypothetical protein OPIT5_29410 [Opitutaceae bacterium TAV5]|nr:hypothetical protein OPIT5_21710 [Opitutaceae bacterium TAV5]AHF94896.1 hypothetical protein OPIT5_29410 [Opitutaceae bacterium TAV5]
MSKNNLKLAQIIRQEAERLQSVYEIATGDPDGKAIADGLGHDTPELLRVLARLVEGQTVYRAFGAPGNWGYGTPIGDALFAAIRDGSISTAPAKK